MSDNPCGTSDLQDRPLAQYGAMANRARAVGRADDQRLAQSVRQSQQLVECRFFRASTLPVIGLISGGAAGTLQRAALRGRLAAAVASGRSATSVENAAAIVRGFVPGGWRND